MKNTKVFWWFLFVALLFVSPFFRHLLLGSMAFLAILIGVLILFMILAFKQKNFKIYKTGQAYRQSPNSGKYEETEAEKKQAPVFDKSDIPDIEIVEEKENEK